MRTDVQTFRDIRSATAAGLSYVVGVHIYDATTGALNLVVEQLAEQSQRRIRCRERQIVFPGHERKPQLLHSNESVDLGEPGRGLVPEFTALNCSVLLGKYRLFGGFTPANTVLLAPPHAPVVDQFIVGQGRKAAQTHIHANHRSVMYGRRRFRSCLTKLIVSTDDRC